MTPSSILRAVLAGAVFGVCASAQPPTPVQQVQPTLEPGSHVESAQRDAACDALIAQAQERYANNGFKLLGKLNDNAWPRPGEPRVPATPYTSRVPSGSHPAGAPTLQMDGTRRALFVNCETREAYISQRGGVIDITYWFGPFTL